MTDRRGVPMSEPGSPRYSELAADRWRIEAVVRRELEALEQGLRGQTHIGRAARPVEHDGSGDARV